MFPLRSGLVIVDVRDQPFLVDMQMGRYLSLNRTGRKILAAMMREEDMDTITANLVQETQVDPPRLKQDIADFYERLVALGLTTMQ